MVQSIEIVFRYYTLAIDKEHTGIGQNTQQQKCYHLFTMNYHNQLTQIDITPAQLDMLLFKKARRVLKSIEHPLRLKILRLIHIKREMNVTDIYKKLRLEQSVVSQHLKWLRDARVVTTKRDGKQICYSVNYERPTEINGIITAFLSK
jgi:DNA-binding transcriptional ArsR family regulator